MTKEYYVDFENGDDSAPGTDPNSPLKTIAKLSSFELPAGTDSVLRRDQVHPGMLKPRMPSVRYGAYGTGSLPVIDSSKEKLNALWVLDVSDLTFESLHFANSPNPNTGNVRISGLSEDVTFCCCENSGAVAHGFVFDGMRSGFLLEDSLIHDNGGTGVLSWKHSGGDEAHWITLLKNTISKNGKSGIALTSSFVRAEENFIIQNGSAAFKESGLKMYGALQPVRRGLLRANFIVDQLGGGEDGSGLQLDINVSEVEVIENVISRCDGPAIDIYRSPGNTIRDNYCIGNCQNRSGQLKTKAEIRISGQEISIINLEPNYIFPTEPDVLSIFIDVKHP